MTNAKKARTAPTIEKPSKFAMAYAENVHQLSTFFPHEFEGKRIIFRGDGYINMTLAAKEYGRDVRKFFKTQETKDYLKALSKLGHIEPNIIKEATRGRNGVTFGHPKLAVFFARWLDVRFAVWCDLMIDNILRGNIQTQVVVHTKEALKQMRGIPIISLNA